MNKIWLWAGGSILEENYPRVLAIRVSHMDENFTGLILGGKKIIKINHELRPHPLFTLYLRFPD